MKLLHILGDSKFGGGSVVVGRLAERAKRDGWSVDVLTTDPVFQEWLRRRRIGVIDLDVIWRDIRPIKDLSGMFHLAKFLRLAGYDVVHTHTSKAGFVGRLAAGIAGTKTVLHTVHGFAFHEASGRLPFLAYITLERIAAMCSDRLVTVSKYHRDWALRVGIGRADKVIAIPNGVPDDASPEAYHLRSLRASLGAANDETVLLSTGRLAAQKGLRHLVDAMPQIVRQSGTPVTLWLAGEGPLRSDLERQAGSLGVDKHIKFLGFRTDIRALLGACDIVVLPSLWEGLSISLLEAMASERPVVTTTIGSNLEVTADGFAAELVSSGESGALAAAVTGLIADPGRRAELARRGRQLFLSSYTEERMLDAYSRLYRELSQPAPLHPIEKARA